MKKVLVLIILFVTVVLSSCSNGQGRLAPKDFAEKIKTTSDAVVIDVRTPGEFSEGHIENAINIDWNEESAESQLKALDPSKSYFIYCLGGGRSASAAHFLRENGFSNVYELSGGMMKWRSEGLAESAGTKKSNDTGMSLESYQALLNNNKTVVIDFYAEWCGPCKKMSPYLTEMQKTMSDKVEIVRIDADKNPELCKTLKVEALPTIYVYKANSKTFEHIGYLSKEDLLKQL